jgi:hypothetical protein
VDSGSRMTAQRVTKLGEHPGAPSVFRARIGFPVFLFRILLNL